MENEINKEKTFRLKKLFKIYEKGLRKFLNLLFTR